MPAKKTESKVEIAKRNSQHLRGTIAETLDSDATHFNDDDIQVLKFHGIYQQDDRDVRGERKDQGLEPDYSFMLRCTIPGGKLTPDQYLTFDELSDTCGNGTLRLTTRQSVQFHGVYKDSLRPLLQGMHKKLIKTLAACGDIERNVMASPAPIADEAHQAVQRYAAEIAEDLAPATKAYHEIWIAGEKVTSTKEEESFYGEQYLPRKFKSGVALADDNSIDVYSYDCGLVAIVENGKVTGLNVVVGGGFGMNHNRADTFAAMAQPLAYIGPEHGVEAVRTVAAIFRDHGNRKDRKHARLKYLLDEWGVDKFRDEFAQRVSFEVQPPKDLPTPGFEDYLGRHEQGDGNWFYGIFVQNGRIGDTEDNRQRSAIRAIVQKHQPGVRITPNQNLLLTDLSEEALDDIEATLQSHGAKTVRELSNVQRYSMACPALPTCGLALTESERVFSKVVSAFEQEFEKLGLEDEIVTLRMTGCPNGCARPYTADIGFVGRKPGEKYNVYVGGGIGGARLADLFAEDIPIDELVPHVRPLLKEFVAKRQPDEGFSDFYHRLRGNGAPRMKLTGKEEATGVSLPLASV
jgi:sulfite reductase beta subunit-like hemoprotein